MKKLVPGPEMAVKSQMLVRQKAVCDCVKSIVKNISRLKCGRANTFAWSTDAR